MRPPTFVSPEFSCPWDWQKTPFQIVVKQDCVAERYRKKMFVRLYSPHPQKPRVAWSKMELRDSANRVISARHSHHSCATPESHSFSFRLNNVKEAILSVMIEYRKVDRAPPIDTRDHQRMDIRHRMSNLFTNGRASDITLKVGDLHLACHKVILMARSPYFRSLLGNRFKEGSLSTVEIHESRVDLFRILIQFLYEGDAMLVCENNCLDLIPLTEKYLMDDMKAICEVEACSPDVINSANVLEALSIAHLHHCDALFRFCVPIFHAHKSALKSHEMWPEMKKMDGFLERLVEAEKWDVYSDVYSAAEQQYETDWKLLLQVPQK